MKKLIWIVLFSLLSVLAVKPQSQPAIAFTNVTVIDMAGSAPKTLMTVMIQGNRIVAVGETGRTIVPKNATVIDARGKFLIPGLWDMHVHTHNTDFLSLYVANGVTGVRDMFHPNLAKIHQWKHQIETGELVGPRIVASGKIVDGPKPIWPDSIAVGNAAEGRQAVTQLKHDGADFVKVYTGLPRDAYFAIADEAKKQGMPFAGHVPLSISAVEASDAGQKSIEHLTGVLLSCSRDEAAIRTELDKAAAESQSTASMIATLSALNVKAVQSYDTGKSAALFARFKKNGTWQCPTLTVLRVTAFLDDPGFTNDPRLKYMYPYLRAYWNPKNDFRFKGRSAKDIENSKKLYARDLEVTRAMHNAGVEFLAGTDTPNPYCFPGFGLHDELALLVEAGFTPMEALQTATINPARYLGRENELGTIEVGKLADLVLLDADPLADIHNTRTINAVVADGRLLNRDALQGILDRIEAANKASKETAR